MVVAVVVVLESHARCIPPFVRTVAMRLRYLFSHVVTSLCIAAIAIRRSDPLAVLAVVTHAVMTVGVMAMAVVVTLVGKFT